jgi:hypothetical protein
MITGTEQTDVDCNCDEGWCYAPEEPGKFRITYAFGPTFKLNIPQVKTATDAALLAHKADFEGKPGISGFLWAGSAAVGSAPDQAATMFPLSPVVNGHCIWAATRHSVFPFDSFVGHYKYNHITYAMNVDLFPLQKIPLVYPPRTHICGWKDPTKGGAANNSAVFFQRLLQHTCTDFSFVDSAAAVNPGHIWIPDPTPLVEGDAVAVFGSPGGGEARSSSLDLATTIIKDLFTLNTKSVSTGLVVGVNTSVICHDASTLGGFCGAVGVNLATSGGWKFSFIHAGEHAHFNHLLTPVRHNHGVSVNDPDFKAAYVAHVIPLLRAAKASLSAAQIVAVENYVHDAFV